MKLFKQVPVLVIGTLLLAGCSQENTVNLENHVDQASYGVGLNIGESLARDAVELNVDAIAEGISDALSGAEKRVDKETLQAAFEKIREEQERKQAALNDAAAPIRSNYSGCRRWCYAISD
jgi:FKBP-type peptidyl-prolyl cis-trans isomerase FklB